MGRNLGRRSTFVVTPPAPCNAHTLSSSLSLTTRRPFEDIPLFGSDQNLPSIDRSSIWQPKRQCLITPPGHKHPVSSDSFELKCAINVGNQTQRTGSSPLIQVSISYNVIYDRSGYWIAPTSLRVTKATDVVDIDQHAYRPNRVLDCQTRRSLSNRLRARPCPDPNDDTLAMAPSDVSRYATAGILHQTSVRAAATPGPQSSCSRTSTPHRQPPQPADS